MAAAAAVARAAAKARMHAVQAGVQAARVRFTATGAGGGAAGGGGGAALGEQLSRQLVRFAREAIKQGPAAEPAAAAALDHGLQRLRALVEDDACEPALVRAQLATASLYAEWGKHDAAMAILQDIRDCPSPFSDFARESSAVLASRLGGKALQHVSGKTLVHLVPDGTPYKLQDISEYTSQLAQKHHVIAMKHHENGVNPALVKNLYSQVYQYASTHGYKEDEQEVDVSLLAPGLSNEELAVDAKVGLGQLYTHRGMHDKAEEQLQEGLSAAEAIGGDKHPRVGLVLACIADDYARRPALMLAEGLYRSSMSLLGIDPTPSHLHTSSPPKTRNAVAAVILSRYANLIRLYPSRGSEADASRAAAIAMLNSYSDGDGDDGGDGGEVDDVLERVARAEWGGKCRLPVMSAKWRGLWEPSWVEVKWHSGKCEVDFTESE